MKDSQCIFCNLGKDKEIIAENELAIAFYDGFPVNPGHALIIPKRHVASYFDLSMDECTAMQALLKVVQTKVEERFHPDGYNIGFQETLASVIDELYGLGIKKQLDKHSGAIRNFLLER